VVLHLVQLTALHLIDGISSTILTEPVVSVEIRGGDLSPAELFGGLPRALRFVLCAVWFCNDRLHGGGKGVAGRFCQPRILAIRISKDAAGAVKGSPEAIASSGAIPKGSRGFG
jgi:hypothetical protein